MDNNQEQAISSNPSIHMSGCLNSKCIQDIRIVVLGWLDTILTLLYYLKCEQATEILYDSEEALFPQVMVAMAMVGK